MLTLIVVMKSEMPYEPELMLFAGMNNHLHAAGLFEVLRSGEPTPKKIWKAIQTLFAAMNEVQELVASRLGQKLRWYSHHHQAMQSYHQLCSPCTLDSRRLEPVNLRLLKSEVAAWADVSHALRGYYELADILIVLDEVPCLEISNLARQLKLNPEVEDDHPRDKPLDFSVVSEHGTHDNEFH